MAAGRILEDVDHPDASVVPRPNASFAIDVPDTLLVQARRGDAAAFEQLYRAFERPVFTLALRLTGNRDDAHDVLQDAMLKLLARIGEFRGEAPFWGWLRQIVVNEALMKLRKRNQLATTTAALDETISDSPLATGEQTLPPAAADAALLLQALDRLPALTRSVLWLYHAEGYTHEEIGAQMQRSTSFSKSQLARGVRRLRALLRIDSVESKHA